MKFSKVLSLSFLLSIFLLSGCSGEYYYYYGGKGDDTSETGDNKGNQNPDSLPWVS